MANQSGISKLLGAFGLRRKVSPGETVGASGTAIYGGYVENKELNSAIGGREARYKTYSEILANASIVGAGVRYYLDFVSQAEWSFTPSDADTDGHFAELCEAAFTKDPATPFRRMVRRAAMYRLYGFSVQEWTAKRHIDGHLTFKDVEPRPQLTIDRWDFEESEAGGTSGELIGVIQVAPQSAQSIYLPRSKIVYMVDDSLSDSPEGFGLFRHMVAPAQRLFRYEQLEGFGFETDLRGIPIGRAPFTELAKLETAGELTREQRIVIEAPMRAFISNHIKNKANLGLLLDSAPYEGEGENASPSSTNQWGVELLQASGSSFTENAAAITRINYELARILGVEHLMLGSSSVGSQALSEDKSNRFHLLVSGALGEIRETFMADLMDPLWGLNGWPDEMKPEIMIEKVQFIDAGKVAAVMRDLATAGAPLAADDPVVPEIRAMMGLKSEVTVPVSTADDTLLDGMDTAALDAALEKALAAEKGTKS